MNKRHPAPPVAPFPGRFQLLRFFLFAALFVLAGGGQARDAAPGDSSWLETSRAAAKKARSPEEKRKIYDAVIARCAGNTQLDAREGTAWAMVAKAGIGDGEEADRLITEVLERFGADGEDEIRRHVAEARHLRAIRTRNQDERLQALAALAAEYADDPDSQARAVAENAALERAKALGDSAGFIAVCDRVIARLSGRPDAESRIRLAKTALRRAEAVPETDLRIRALDALVAEFDEAPEEEMRDVVELALRLKAKAVPEAAEKIRLLDEAMARRGRRGAIVSQFLNDRLLLTPGRSGKSALYDWLLSSFGERFDASQTASLIFGQAGLAESDAGRVRCYDLIIDSFGNREDGAADFYVVCSLEAKIPLIREPAEKLALYDELIAKGRQGRDHTARRHLADNLLGRAKLVGSAGEAKRAADEIVKIFLDGSGEASWRDFEEAVEMKSKASGDSSFLDALYEEVTARNPGGEISARARFARAGGAADPRERARRYGEFADLHRNSDNRVVRDLVVRAMLDRADLLADGNEQTALLQAAVERCEAWSGDVPGYIADRAARKLAKLTGAPEDEILRRGQTAAPKDGEETASALWELSRSLKGAAKAAALDEIIAKYRRGADADTQRSVLYALQDRAELGADLAEKTRFYDQIMFELPDYNQVTVSIWAEIAFMHWTRLTDREPGSQGAVNAEGNARIDRYLAIYRDYLNPYGFAVALRAKLAATADPLEKERWRDEFLEVCKKGLAGWPGGDLAIRGSWRFNLANLLAEELFAKVKQTSLVGEKVKLLDEILDLARWPGPDSASWILTAVPALSEKASLLGDSAVNNAFYDEQIRFAASEVERAWWQVLRIEAIADARERQAAWRELAARFADSLDPKARGIAASRIVANARQAPSPREEAELYDAVIEKFGGFGDSEMAYPIAKALIEKARREKKPKDKFRIYEDVIAKYKDSTDFSVRRIIDEIIAERFRWLDKTAAKP